MRTLKLAATLSSATIGLAIAGPASAKDWIVQYGVGPVAPVDKCEVVWDDDGAHHMANGHELPAGFICDSEEGLYNGGGSGNVGIGTIKDVKEETRAPVRGNVRPGNIRGCRDDEKCPPPRPRPRK